MHQNDIILGMVDRIGDLGWGQADVDRMQDRAHHRHGKETFQITVRVPIHHTDHIPLAYTSM